ncbi:hypothetical protein R3P38DRAFT_3224787 [Favolaschia claudopus]|uniref:Uncharacterized protein n=1 Tax=Favolaschia claudopus TaxID=2862362 RepID=A0AAV9ZV55_9AGAR
MRESRRHTANSPLLTSTETTGNDHDTDDSGHGPPYLTHTHTQSTSSLPERRGEGGGKSGGWKNHGGKEDEQERRLEGSKRNEHVARPTPLGNLLPSVFPFVSLSLLSIASTLPPSPKISSYYKGSNVESVQGPYTRTARLQGIPVDAFLSTMLRPTPIRPTTSTARQRLHSVTPTHLHSLISPSHLSLTRRVQAIPHMCHYLVVCDLRQRRILLPCSYDMLYRAYTTQQFTGNNLHVSPCAASPSSPRPFSPDEPPSILSPLFFITICAPVYMPTTLLRGCRLHPEVDAEGWSCTPCASAKTSQDSTPSAPSSLGSSAFLKSTSASCSSVVLARHHRYRAFRCVWARGIWFLATHLAPFPVLAPGLSMSASPLSKVLLPDVMRPLHTVNHSHQRRRQQYRDVDVSFTVFPRMRRGRRIIPLSSVAHDICCPEPAEPEGLFISNYTLPSA